VQQKSDYNKKHDFRSKLEGTLTWSSQHIIQGQDLYRIEDKIRCLHAKEK